MTKDASKLFCPRCGNATMERVEVSVGPDGAEFFGVRKKYCLKGTRFSLPKPKVSALELEGGLQSGELACGWHMVQWRQVCLVNTSRNA